jgi:hypothetical protein
VYVWENMHSSFSQVSMISPHGSHTVRRDNVWLPLSILNEPWNTRTTSYFNVNRVTGNKEKSKVCVLKHCSWNSYWINTSDNFFLWRCGPMRARGSAFTRFLDHTQRLTIFGRTLLDEWSARRRDLYLTIHNTQKRKTSMPRWDSNPYFSRRAAVDLRHSSDKFILHIF